MNAYEILRDVHRIGSRVSGTVMSRDVPEMRHGVPCGQLEIKTQTAYRALLPYSNLVDEFSSFSPEVIPEIGAHIDAVVDNFVDGAIYLSSKPSDLDESSIRKWEQYYDYIASLTVGHVVSGIVERAMPFGLFVNIGGPFLGLIDIAHTRINGGVQLPGDVSDWPAVGDPIQCCIAYFRFRNQQIGLGWLPENDA
ncbi:MAG: hypothetical protein ACTHK7_19795 [Aureliella sp.]